MVDSEYSPDNYESSKKKYWSNNKKSTNAKICS